MPIPDFPIDALPFLDYSVERWFNHIPISLVHDSLSKEFNLTEDLVNSQF